METAEMNFTSACLRPDRFLSCYVVYPVVKRMLTGAVPILMYHSVSWERDKRFACYYETNTYPSVFEKHIEYLVASGYEPVGLDDLAGRRANGSGKKLVAVTFDDGYLDFYSNAYPILKKYSVTATMFLPTAHIGANHRGPWNRAHLGWDQVRELSRNGIEFGSHSHNHLTLSDLCADEIKTELRVSKEIIENMIGKPVSSFSYPYAFPGAKRGFVRFFKGVLAQTGYKICVTTGIGLNSNDHDLLALKRIPVNSHDDGLFFAAKIEGAYDWLNPVQGLFKDLVEIQHRIRSLVGKKR